MSNIAQKLTVIEGGKGLSLVKSETSLKASAKRIREIQQEEAKLKRGKEQLMASLVDGLDQGTVVKNMEKYRS